RKPALPFGGLQMLYIGDLSQLPPVVNDYDWRTLSKYYSSAFFFHAQVMNQKTPIYMELKKIYRQSDAEFINILNNIRNNQVVKQDLEVLERLYRPGFKPEKEGEYIILTTHNAKADVINQKELARLPGTLHKFQARISG